MKSRLEKVYSKLPNQKVDLKKQKVELSIFDDIEEVLSAGFGLEEFAQEAIDIANEKSLIASDIVKFDMTDAYLQAEELITDATRKLDELGLDDTPLQSYIDSLNELDAIKKNLIKQVDRIRN